MFGAMILSNWPTFLKKPPNIIYVFFSYWEMAINSSAHLHPKPMIYFIYFIFLLVKLYILPTLWHA